MAVGNNNIDTQKEECLLLNCDTGNNLYKLYIVHCKECYFEDFSFPLHIYYSFQVDKRGKSQEH